MIDPERLEQMRRFAAEMREDLERRQAEDPLGAFELQQMQRAGPPAMVFKTHDNEIGFQNCNPIADVPPFSDEQTEIMAAVIAGLRQELQDAVDATIAPLRERCARLEGQITMLTTMLGGDASRSFEASEVVRKLKVQR
jgi:hypothetical protein